MFAPDDSSTCRQLTFWLENDVRRFFCCLEGPNRSVYLAPALWIPLINATTERIVISAFEIVTRLNKERFSAIVRQGSLADLTICITDFCKVTKYQKVCLLAMAMLRGVVPVMLESQDCSLTASGSPEPNADDEPMIKYWFPVLFGFYDVIMNGEDLEIRRL